MTDISVSVPENNEGGNNGEVAAALAANDAGHSASDAAVAAQEAEGAASVSGANADEAQRAADEANANAGVSVAAAQATLSIKQETENTIREMLEGFRSAVKSEPVGAAPVPASGESQQQITAGDKPPKKGHWLTRPLWGKDK